ncbi:hypothetical protein GGI04_001512 [Coemansia thaxteri]|nr:hypothetical protein GGI04_001512 [Coemansia thaxteri]KAJ2474158.1 hypothetical protein GGI02_000285 [Coemansia sp. RSA 2322]
MLSADPGTAGAAATTADATQPVDIASSWLPDFDSPAISIALSTLPSAEELSAVATALPQAVIVDSSTAQHLSSPATAPVCDTKLDADAACADDNASAAADALPQSQSPHLQTMVKVEPELSSAAACPGDPSAATALLDSLGLSFEFSSDPTMDSITDSPLYLSLGPHNAPACAPESDANEQSSPEPLPHKPRARRTSIAGMIKRRLSKCADVNGDLVSAPTPASPTVAVAPHQADDASPATEPVADVGDLPAQPELAPEPEAHCCAADGTQPGVGDTQHDSLPPAVASPPQPVDPTENSPAIIDKPAESPVTHTGPQTVAATTTSTATNTPAGADVCDEVNNECEDAPPQAPSESRQQEPESASDPLATQPAVEDASSSSSSSSASSASQQLPPARRPSKYQNLDRRSSRILEGITRKVQHVRQTTSMVLRRSVGSRLSIRPGNFSEPRQSSACDAAMPAEADASSADDSQAEVSVQAPEVCGDESGNSSQPCSDANEVKAKGSSASRHVNSAEALVHVTDAAANTSSSTSAVGSDNNANSIPSGADADMDADHIDVLGNKLATVAAARSTTAVNTQDDHAFHSADKARTPVNAIGTISRKLSSVKRGTNVAVRNSVTRVKNIFTAKKPVAA